MAWEQQYSPSSTIPRKPVRKPEYGRRLLPNVIDERARNRHSRPYASIPLTNDPRDGFWDISYAVFANAINRCAIWLKTEIGTSSSFETLTYIGPQDLRYQVLCIAAMKTGHVMFFTSPRNSMEAHLHLLKESSAKAFITTSDEMPIVSAIFKRTAIPKFRIPDLDEILDEKPVEKIPFDARYTDYREHPFMLLHTSGSTGLPKIIIIRHGYTTSMDAYSAFTSGSEIVRRAGGRRIFNPFPPFHMAGIMWSLPIVCWVDSTIVLPPPIPITAALADSIHRYGNVVYSTLMPSIIVELTKDEKCLEKIAELEGLAFAGGPLPRATGDKLSKLTTIHASYGSTEMMAPPVLEKRPEDWQYLHFDIEHSGIEFRRQGEDSDLYELVIVRKPELASVQAIFVTFPELQEYHTKDLFTPHPEQPNHWLYAGRLDDIIVSSSGEKLNPVTMEGVITSGSPQVVGCVVVGQGKFQSGLIIEPKDHPNDDASQKALLNKVWPVVQKANEGCPNYGKIDKEHIIFTTKDKPFPRAGKGTIQRAKALELYQKEIDALYEGRSSGSTEQTSAAKVDLSSVEATTKSLQTYIVEEIGIEEISSSDDIFTYGVDSLQVLSMVRVINDSLPAEREPIQAKQIYEHPTIETLAQTLHDDRPPPREDDDDLDNWVKMQQTFKNLTYSLGVSRPQTGSSKRRHQIRALLGRAGPLSLHPTNASPTVEKYTNYAILEDPEYDATLDKTFLSNMVPPDGGRTAWLQVLASFLINLNTFGLVNTFGDYQDFYSENLLSQYSNFDISWIGTLQASLLLIIGVFSGPLFDKGFFRTTLAASSLTLVFAIMMLSISTEFYQILLAQGILMGICLGLLYIPSVALISLYFRDRRGLALGLALSGAPLGGIIYPVIFQSLLSSIGFGWANRVIAFIALATLTSAFIIIRPSNQMHKPGRQFFDFGAVKELPFATFIIAAFLVYCAWLIPYFLTPAFATSLGEDPKTANYLLTVLNAAQFFGRLIPAYLSDRYGGEYPLFLAELAAAILGLSWITINTLGGFIEFQIFYGFVSGMIATLPAVVVPYVCPTLAVLGTRMGMVYAAAGVGVLLGNPVALAASNVDNGVHSKFLGAQLWMGLTALVGSAFYIVTARAAQQQRKRVDMYKEEKPGVLDDLRALFSRRKSGRKVVDDVDELPSSV